MTPWAQHVAGELSLVLVLTDAASSSAQRSTAALSTGVSARMARARATVSPCWLKFARAMAVGMTRTLCCTASAAAWMWLDMSLVCICGTAVHRLSNCIALCCLTWHDAERRQHMQAC